ncbi:MAG: hypothetical protein PHX57_11830 [Desulfobulbaceae bacterium]|jgi:hypothetical protein|nr:hypothetical protein [Lascolabacillus sp.]MDD3620070.1 hypothetical protein [Desulfobulbaceae bacterium]
MTFTDIEKEIIFLKAIQELIDEMVNYEVLQVTIKDPDSSVMFKTLTHQKFFNIILVDFLSQSDKHVMGESLSYLGAIRQICATPHFNISNSIRSLAEACQEFSEWLEQEIKVEIWLPTTEIETTLSIKRVDFLKMCGNISKHNFSRLSGVVRELREVFKRNGIEVGFQEALLILDEFYERFHDDILNYHGSTLAEFLNNIRWGIHKYLEPEFSKSITYDKIDSTKYQYTYPVNVTGKFPRNMYWELMNKIRSGPFVKQFKVTRYLKLRY